MLGLLKRTRFVYYANNLHSTISNNYEKNNLLPLKTIKLDVQCKNIFDTKEEKRKRKSIPISKIILTKPDGSKTITLLEEAVKIAKRHNLHLIKEPQVDPKSLRSIYKLVDYATYINDTDSNEMNPNEHDTKGTKKFAISSKIAEHDLNVKLNNINKLLKKNYVIQIILTHPDKNNKNQEEVLQYIQKNIQGVKTQEKKQDAKSTLTYSPLRDTCNSSDVKNKDNKEP